MLQKALRILKIGLLMFAVTICGYSAFFIWWFSDNVVHGRGKDFRTGEWIPPLTPAEEFFYNYGTFVALVLLAGIPLLTWLGVHLGLIEMWPLKSDPHDASVAPSQEVHIPQKAPEPGEQRS